MRNSHLRYFERFERVVGDLFEQPSGCPNINIRACDISQIMGHVPDH